MRISDWSSDVCSSDLNIERLGFFDHQRQFGELLDDDIDAMAELLADQRTTDVRTILVAVADDHAAGPCATEHRRQFRLAAGFDADPLAAVAYDLLDDIALLVVLDRIERGVLTLITVFGTHFRKRAGTRRSVA